MNKTRLVYDRWSEVYDREPNSQKTLEESIVVEMVSAKPGDRILDAACGTGRYCKYFKESGADVIGIDFSEGMLSVARSNLPDIEFINADLTEPLPFPDGMFNKVNCAQTLKHLVKIHPTLSEFARILRPEGKITFSVTHPDMDWEGYVISYNPDIESRGRPEIHHHRFCDYFEAFEKTGLRLHEFRQVPVNESIREYLTPESYEKVKGRYQIAIFHSVKEQIQPVADGDRTR